MASDDKNEKASDGREAVTRPWSQDDFKAGDTYKQGPTDDNGAGKCNEKHK